MKAERTGFEPVMECYPHTGLANRSTSAASADHIDTSADPENVLASCLALLKEESTELALVVERWNELPELVRAGIVAMVKAAAGTPPKTDPDRP